MGAIGVFVFAAVGIAGFYLSRPSMETIYNGLTPMDVGRMASALESSGIRFDVNDKGDALLVPYGLAGRARAILARQGLPSGSTSGYELFDQLGSMGLTSFMQEVTRVRALEGEIARTIQSMEGVEAARVHLVLPDRGSFRRQQKDPSASVVLRLSGERGDFAGTQAVRLLVAAALPGMKIEQISVLSTGGSVLAAAGDAEVRAPQTMLMLERKIGSIIEENAGRTLSPYLGQGNFQISVALKLNTDKRQISEQTFDPKSRVERSVRVVRQEGSSENSSGSPVVGVDQNIPQEEGDEAGGDKTKRQEERREELTNYEISSTTVQTVSDGYKVEGMTIAVLLNRKALMDGLGAGASDEAVAAQLERLKRLVAAAAGLSEERGDKLELSAVDFLADTSLLEPVPDIGILQHLMRNLGSIINGLVALAVVGLILWLAVRPTLNVLSELPAPALQAPAVSPASVADSADGLRSLPAGAGAEGEADRPPIDPAKADLLKLAGPEVASRMSAQKRLEALIEAEEEQVVAILKQWIRKETTS